MLISLLTDEGQCCTFNAVDVKYMFFRGSDEITLSNWTAEGEAVDWTPEKGYGQKKSFQDYAKKVFPRPALGTGAHLGLSLVLNASLEEYFCSSGSSAGFKMMMHSPIETPKITNYGYLLSAGMESRIAINLEVQSAEPSIRSVEMKYRNCLFASESQLKFYRTYSKSNCELECELQRVLAICGCIPYYLPRMSDNVTICGLKDLNCTKNVQIASDNLMNMDVKCSLCPQACCSVNYLPVVTTNPLIYGNSYLEDGVHVQQRSELEELAVVHFFFEVNSFRAKTKEELSTFTDFLANSGGILGLFMGFSILAVIEFLYFVFLAPYCALKKLIMYRLEVRMVKANKAPQEKEENVRAIIRPSHFTYSDNNVDYAIARKNLKSRPLYSYYE
ncbi:unnamed protein product [Hermetia illucens]|uniref:Pickpocket protein 28 n=1 Tax=Hermetia illucens TaxID=343691 RepID=A0A7R8UWP4_HERIL|nr:unnamed protein product [Hermetia illucens]